jgi:YVTN family beta-propeller protein
MFERAPGQLEFKLTVIPVGKGPEAIALSPDGKQVWTATGGDSHVAIIDAVAGTVIDTVPVPTQRINRLQFTPTESECCSRIQATAIWWCWTRRRGRRSSG